MKVKKRTLEFPIKFS